MIDKTGRVEMHLGTRVHWVTPNQVQEYLDRGWQHSVAPVSAVLKPRKQQQVEAQEPQLSTITKE